MSPHPLTSFEIQNYYQNGPKFNSVYSRKHLSKIKDGAFVINHDEKLEYNTSIRFDNVWILLYWIYDLMLKGKSSLDYTKLFSPNDSEKNNEIILKYFQ